MLIGLSVTQCIRDIADGLVPVEEVAYIIAGTKFADKEEYKDACIGYARLHWHRNPMDAVGIAATLWAEGKVIQPRLYDQPILMLGGGPWLECKQVRRPQITLDPARIPEFYKETQRWKA